MASMASAAVSAMAPATAGTPQPGPSPSGLRPEGTTVPVPGLDPASSPRVSRLESIEAGGATIEAADIRVAVTPLPDGTPGVTVVSTNPAVAAGLYVGTITTADGQPLAPVHLYVSRAEAPVQ
jgi:hypothetical protein